MWRCRADTKLLEEEEIDTSSSLVLFWVGIPSLQICSSCKQVDAVEIRCTPSRLSRTRKVWSRSRSLDAQFDVHCWFSIDPTVLEVYWFIWSSLRLVFWFIFLRLDLLPYCWMIDLMHILKFIFDLSVSCTFNHQSFGTRSCSLSLCWTSCGRRIGITVVSSKLS